MTGRNPPLYFPVRQTTGGIGHRVKQFFGVETSTLNARNNKITYIINRHHPLRYYPSLGHHPTEGGCAGGD